MQNRFFKLAATLSEIDRYSHKLASEEMAKYGLSSPHAVYLDALYQHDEGITAAKLAKLCGRNKADVSRMVAALEKKELVCKERVSGTLYRARLRLTQKGKEAAESLRQRVTSAMEHMEYGISEENRENFYRALELITANMQRLSLQGLPKK